jgi:hypothetical protein
MIRMVTMLIGLLALVALSCPFAAHRNPRRPRVGRVVTDLALEEGLVSRISIGYVID